MSWFFLALSSAFFYAFADIIGKYVTDKKSDPVILSMLAKFYSGVASCFFMLFEPFKFNPTLTILIWVASASIFYAIGTFTYYLSIKITPISEFSLFTRSSAFITFLGGVFIFHESLSTFQIFGVALIILAIVALTYNGKKLTLHKGGLLALFTALMLALGNMVDKGIYANFSKSAYMTMGYFTTTIFLFPSAFKSWKKSNVKPKLKTHLLVFITSSLFAIGGYLVFSAYKERGPISLTQLLTQFRIPLTVIYGLIIFKEKDRLSQKFVAMVLLIIGSYFLQLS